MKFRDNHAWDCEAMQCVAACLANVLAGSGEVALTNAESSATATITETTTPEALP